jgi:hypothetical protein
MVVVTSSIVVSPMCHIFPCNILVTQVLGRILESFISCLASKSGVNHGNWLTCL